MRPPTGLISRAAANPLLRRVLRNSGYLLSANALSMGASMLQGALAARLLGVEGLGIVGLVTDFATNVNRLTSFRGQPGRPLRRRVRRATRRPEAAAVFKAAGLVGSASSLAAVVLILLLAPVAATYLAHDPATAPLFKLYGLAILANLVNESATGLLQYYDRFHYLAQITVGSSLLTLALMVAAFLAGGGLAAVVLAYTIGKASGAITVSVLAAREAGLRWGRGWWRTPLSTLAPRWREMARFATSTNLSTTITLITRDSELLWLGLLTDPGQVGYYKVARALASAVSLPVEPMISTTYRETAVEAGQGVGPT
jgi:O-antigen/teichoic acid export membrane protein